MYSALIEIWALFLTHGRPLHIQEPFPTLLSILFFTFREGMWSDFLFSTKVLAPSGAQETLEVLRNKSVVVALETFSKLSPTLPLYAV